MATAYVWGARLLVLAGGIGAAVNGAGGGSGGGTGLALGAVIGVGMVGTAAGCGGGWKGSVGAVLAKDNRTGRVFVREAPPEMGASRAGITVDDEILAIDGASVLGLSPAQVHEKIAGDVGSRVTLTVKRADGVRDIVVERGPLK